ncbi:tyrosine 3-monooxygenase [Caerostris extrusa]|uniref:Tyrosine 3-monooxygenase n=1 Tax=Caerostris extrusa TaxID=172846 RepID=A0AAV4UGB4_CAEEX|nr:tyrosine 3-monooxygenase [Caerostris extrusa]
MLNSGAVQLVFRGLTPVLSREELFWISWCKLFGCLEQPSLPCLWSIGRKLEIGLASLGASDENIEKLSTIYFYTIEFGLCKENNGIKAYGAGLLSSYGELQNAISGKPKIRPFEPEITAITPYNDSTYLETYFVADSFEEAKDKIRDFVDSHFRRPYDFIYDPYTDSIVKLDSFELIQNVADTMKSQLSSLNYAVKCLQK